jgi:spoIIIJ-associated protein
MDIQEQAIITQDVDQTIEKSLDFLATLLAEMDIACDLHVPTEDHRKVTIQIDTVEDAGVLIGRKGSTLQSIQYLMNVTFGSAIDRRINIDVGDYRQRQDEKYIDIAKTAIQSLKDGEQRIVLEPMAAAERKIVHQWIATHSPEVVTYSTGEDPNRCLVLERRQDGVMAPNELTRRGGREPRNFDASRGGAYNSRRPR